MLNLEKWLLIVLSLLLCVIGIFFIYESGIIYSFNEGSQFFLVRGQAAGLAVGVLGLLVGGAISVKWYLRWPYVFYVMAIILACLCFVDIPALEPYLQGVAINGARRWVLVGGVSVQVVEMMKFCVVIFFSYLATKTKDWQVFGVYLLPIVGLMLLQKDLGSLLVVWAIVFGIYLLAGGEMKKMLMIGTGALVAILLMIVVSDYRRERLMTYLDPERDPQGKGMQVLQMQIAIGRGRITGEGIGASRQKLGFVPMAYSDSIFSIVAEEVGFVGVSLILFCYMFFLYLIWRIVQLAPLDEGSKLVGYGIFVLFLAQIFINLGAISGLTPLTGITLPFFSAGGSSLAMSLFLVGVMVSLAKTEPKIKVRKRKYV